MSEWVQVPGCSHSAQDWYIDKDGHRGCSECDEEQTVEEIMKPLPSSLKPGDHVVIRRTSGHRQEATVRWAVDRRDELYLAPECVAFSVEFIDSDGRWKKRGCTADDLLEVKA